MTNSMDFTKKQIDRVEIVSFDMFDTLLFHHFLKPIELFLYIQELYDK